jgi:hypothetical protein
MKNVPEDGLIQRFIPCIMSAQNIDGPYVDARQAIATWRNLIEWGFSITERSSDFHIALSAAARQLFDAEEKSIRQLVINTEDLSPSYASHLGKHPGMLAEIALVFHIFGEDAGPNKVLGNEVGEVAMRYAIRFMRKVRRHAYALYSSILSTSPAYELARTLARSIAAADDPILIIGRDWMTQHCQAFKKADDQLRRQAVQILEDADWLKARLDARSYGSWPSRYTVNKNVFQLFAREGEQWRARRAAVKDAITEIE